METGGEGIFWLQSGFVPLISEFQYRYVLVQVIHLIVYPAHNQRDIYSASCILAAICWKI